MLYGYVCLCVCVLHRDGHRMAASRASSIDSHVSDQLQ